MNGPFLRPDELPRRVLAPGIEAGVAWGRHLLLSRVEIAPDGVIPRHSHPHEQAGICLEGEFELEIDGETRRVVAGELYLIPGEVPHSARGVGCSAVTLDIFSPVREDYIVREPEDSEPPRDR